MRPVLVPIPLGYCVFDHGPRFEREAGVIGNTHDDLLERIPFVGRVDNFFGHGRRGGKEEVWGNQRRISWFI